MKFHPTSVVGAYEVELELKGDERGFFARVFCSDELAAQGLEPSILQVNSSMSAVAGTLRGMHYQIAPHGETKLVRCLRGEIFDVVLDLRRGSPSFGKWHGAYLTPENRRMLYVPKGCAHGFMTLKPDTEILYFVSAGYDASSERIIRWDDPTFAIAWPIKPAVLSDKDKGAGEYDPELHEPGYACAS